jgi:hypothetical protein
MDRLKQHRATLVRFEAKHAKWVGSKQRKRNMERQILDLLEKLEKLPAEP